MTTSLGLPDTVLACLFDLDGVLTDTARVHRRAWAQAFDAYLRERDGDAFVPFDPERDYEEHVDGRPRADGVRGFLASRGITLPEGEPGDLPTAETVSGLGRRKNALVQELLARDGVQVFQASVDYVRAVRAAGLRTAVVSSSASTEQVLEVTGLSDLFEVRVDAQRACAEGLAGKPAPDTYLFAARALGVAPAQAAVFEDALSGVRAGVAGGFAAVIGVARGGQHAALREAGATVVVSDLAELVGR